MSHSHACVLSPFCTQNIIFLNDGKWEQVTDHRDKREKKMPLNSRWSPSAIRDIRGTYLVLMCRKEKMVAHLGCFISLWAAMILSHASWNKPWIVCSGSLVLVVVPGIIYTFSANSVFLSSIKQEEESNYLFICFNPNVSSACWLSFVYLEKKNSLTFEPELEG